MPRGRQEHMCTFLGPTAAVGLFVTMLPGSEVKSSHLFEKEGTLAICTLSLDPEQEGGGKGEGFRQVRVSPRPLSGWTHRSISYPAFSWTLG